MSKVCSICGRKPGFGNNRSHSMAATRRRFDPNLQRMRVLVDGIAKRAYVCTRCIKAGKVHKALWARFGLQRGCGVRDMRIASMR
jgi:large subunit ribosomal protein L28